MAGIISPADSLAAGEALEAYATRAIEILNGLPGGHHGEAEPSQIGSYASIAAGCSHVLAVGFLLTSDVPTSPSVVALVRAGVESFGRAWRILESPEATVRNEVSEGLRSSEISTAWKKGLDLRWRDGKPARPEDVDLPPAMHERYTVIAIAMLEQTGRSYADAVADYSFMSSIAHGEGFGISSMSVDAGGVLAIGLSTSRAKELVHHLFTAMTITTGKFLAIHAGTKLQELVVAEAAARRRLAAVFG